MKKTFIAISSILILLFLVACGGRSVKITFDAKGGTAVESMTVTQLTEITEPSTTRTGYTFKGWYTEDTYVNEFEFSSGATRNITLYAKWEINQYTIDFETDSAEVINPITADYQSNLTIPSSLTRDGYTFGGWYTDSARTKAFESTRMPAENLTLFAKWNAIFHTLSFFVEDSLLTTRQVQWGEEVLTLPAVPVKTGYNGSWNIEIGQVVTSDMTVEAVYTLKTYTVTFVDQWETVYDTQTVNHGSSPVLPDTPVKEGFTFSAYSEDVENMIITENTVINVLFSPITYLVTFRVQGSGVKTETVVHGSDATAPSVSVDGYVFKGWDKEFTDITGNLEVNAILEPIPYNIHLNGNGGLFADEEETDIITADYQSTVNYSVQPSRTGYTFAGWYLNPEGTGSPVVLTNYTMPLNGLNLYAKWTLVTYNITYYNLLGAQNGNPQSYNITSNITLTPPTTRNGYTFAGWFDAETGGNQIANINAGTFGHLNIYARWTANTYTITFNTNGGTAIDPLTVTYNQPFTLDGAVKTGYTFSEWQLNGTTFVSGTWTRTSNITIDAIYTANEYTITFNTNGGTAIAPMTVTYDQAFTLPVAVKTGYTFSEWQLDGVTFISGIWTGTSNITIDAIYNVNVYNITYNNLQSTTHTNPLNYTIETPTITLTDPTERTGYTFVGWFTSLSGGTEVTEVILGSTGDLVIYARWLANSYTLTFDTAGGDAITAMTVTYGQSFILPDAVQDGYTFVGWTYNALPFTSGTWSIDSDITITANWTEWPAVYFESNGGTEVSSISVAPGDAVTEPTSPTRTGYTFGGWYSDIALTTPYTFSVMPSENITLYAAWNVVTYNITYENLLTTTHTNPLNYTIETPTITLTDPTARTGYTFVGWFTSLSGGTEVTEVILGSTGDIALYARWTANTYTITFNTNGGTAISPLTVTYDQAFTLPIAVKTGYTFSEWQLVGVTFVSGTWNLTNNITLDAIYTANTYTITFNIDGVLTNVSLDYDYIIQASDVPATPTKPNYDLTSPYWDVNPIGFTVTGDVTFNAVYVGNPMTVSYETNGGNTMADDTVPYNELLAQPTAPTRNGYTFLAWYVDSSLTILYDFNNPVISNLTLYAAWELDFYTWDIEYIFLQEDLNDPNIVITDPNQGSILNSITGLYYGLEVSPVQMFEGYVFDYFLYDGVEYANIEQLIMVTKDMVGLDTIQVIYRKIILTITFAQDPDLFDPASGAIVSFRVYYNDDFLIANAPALVQPSGALAIWDRTLFDNVKTDITVYAIYYVSDIKTVTFIDRGVIKYIGSQVDELIDDLISSTSILWDLYRPGYKFLGWYTAETGGTQIIQGDLLFSQFPDLRTSLYAQWLQLQAFVTPNNMTVTTSETEIVITWNLTTPLINGLQPAGYDFYLNNRLISGLATMPVLSGTTYTLTLLSTNPDFDEFAELLTPGTHKLSLRVLGDEDNHYHSAFTNDFTYSIDSVFEGDPTTVAVYDYFIIETFGETKRYIFYTNLDYQFASTYTFEMVTGQEFATASANTISTNGISGSFKFRMIRDGYPTVTYDALVVHDIKQFAIGNNYQAFLNAKVANQTAFIDEAVEYYVGTGNEFYLDLRMVNNQGQRIPLAQTLLDYTLYQYDTGNFIEVAPGNLDDYITFLPNNQLQLKALTIGGTFKLVVEPKYQANSMQVAPLEFIFTVNNGVNVYTNQQLKTYFSDYNVHTINIHASFIAELSSEQKNLDGSPINRVPTVSNPVTGNVYQRYSATIADDTLTIQGNFMSIDGSTLPFNNANSGSGTVGFAQSFEVISVQVGMFYYGMGPSSGTTNDSSFTMNNLIVKGNTSTPYVDFSGTPEDIEIQERLMSKNSGGYTGVMVRAGSAYLDNLVVLNTVIAVFNTTYGYKTNTDPNLITIDYVKTYNNWANTIYLHGGLGFIIKNSEIGSSGGAAIHLVDTHPATFDGSWNELTNPNPYLEIQDNNIFSNWVSGEEAWFKAYGMSQVALTLKSGIENGISGTGRSIINLYTDPVTGLQTEKINFILLTEPYSTAEVYSDPQELNQVSGSEVYLNLGAYEIERAFNYLSSGDPRISSGQFAFPVGAYSDVAAFGAYIYELGTYVGAPTAEAYGPAGAFYGLTAMQTANVLDNIGSYGGSFRAAVEGLYPSQVYPQYIEVLAPVPVFPSGYSVVIIEFAE